MQKVKPRGYWVEDKESGAWDGPPHSCLHGLGNLQALPGAEEAVQPQGPYDPHGNPLVNMQKLLFMLAETEGSRHPETGRLAP